MSEAVLDASAVLALLRNEPGSDVVRTVIHRSAIVSVNLTEVVSRLWEWGTTETDIHTAVHGLPSQTLPYDKELAIAAGLLRGSTRHLGLSVGDRACLALAAKLGVPALTADRRWAGVDVGVDIRLIRA